MNKQKNILIIDDHANNRQLMEDILTFHNPLYTCQQAANAEIALSMLSKGLPDLILIDWEMPGMNGLEFIQMAKANPVYEPVPIIMITGVMTSTDSLKKAFESGAVDYVRKPIHANELIARTNSVIKLADYHQMEIECKKREISQLATNLLQKNEILTKVSDLIVQAIKAHRLPTDANETLYEITKYIGQEIDEHVWKHFQFFFEGVEKGFIKRLSDNYPNLTMAEMKMALLLRLNLSSKEIANILCQTPESVKVLRGRLRKKLDIESEQNLQSLILSI